MLDADDDFFHRPEAVGAIGAVKKVHYSDKRPPVTFLDPTIPLESHAANLIRDVFLTKGLEWAYEKEWRLFLPLNDLVAFPHDVSGQIHLFPLTQTVLKAVIVGARASEATVDAVRQVLNATPSLGHVALAKCRISDTNYEVAIEPMSRQ